jgi:hypothetical protein
VSHGPDGTLANPVPRSQSAILSFIETTFSLPSLHTDDYYANDNMSDMFDFSKNFNFIPVTGLGSYHLTSLCGVH